MEKKIKIVFEILFVVIAIFYYYKNIFVPQFRTKMGSSDYLIQTESYSNMVELFIYDKVNFAFVWNREEKIYHMFFFSEDSACLYNKNIEGKSFDSAIGLVFQLLNENNYLNSGSSIKIIRYGAKDYQDFRNSFVTNLNQYGIFNFLEEQNTLERKSQELGLGEIKKKSLLLAMDFYSKERGKLR